MKRRNFIKISGAASLATIIPSTAFASVLQEDKFSLTQKLLLKGFDDEQEEYPSLVSDGNGNMWIHTLRRMAYPENTELVTSFHYNGIDWTETAAVTKSPGQFEAPVSACARGGKPVVAWTEVKDKSWLINVATMNGKDYREPYTFQTIKGRSINPVLLAVDENRTWIAWENLLNGKFTIYIH